MSFPVINPYPQIIGLRGTGLNGGSVYIGVASEDPQINPQPVYWDADLTIQATQPLPVQGGYLIHSGSPANAYAAASYSIRVRDSHGVQVFYNPAVEPQISGPFVDIRDFGAKVDGVTDDRAAVQAAIDFINGIGGGTVQMPAGTVLIGGALYIKSFVNLVGQGKTTTIKVANGTNATAIKSYQFDNFVGNNDYGPFPYAFSLQSFQVDGNGASSVYGGSNTAGYGIAIAAAGYLLDELWVIGAAQAGILTIGTRDSTNVPDYPADQANWLEPVWGYVNVQRCGGNNIHYAGVNDVVMKTVITAIAGSAGIYFAPGVAAEADFIHSYSNHGYGVHLDGASVRITRCQARDGLIENFVANGGGTYKSWIGLLYCDNGNRGGTLTNFDVQLTNVAGFQIDTLQVFPNNGDNGVYILADGDVNIGQVEIIGSGSSGLNVDCQNAHSVNISGGTVYGFSHALDINGPVKSHITLSLGGASTCLLNPTRANDNVSGNIFNLALDGSPGLLPATSFNPYDIINITGQGGAYPPRYHSRTVRTWGGIVVDALGVASLTIAHDLIQTPDPHNVLVTFSPSGTDAYAPDFQVQAVVTGADDVHVYLDVICTKASATVNARIKAVIVSQIGQGYDQ